MKLIRESVMKIKPLDHCQNHQQNYNDKKRVHRRKRSPPRHTGQQKDGIRDDPGRKS